MTKTDKKDFNRLMTAGAVSGLGDWMGTFGFMALALSASDSSGAVGGILTLRLLPAALGGTFVTRIVAKLGRQRAMVLMDFIRAGIVAMVPLLDQLWWIYVWAFCLEGASIIFVTARDSSIPDLSAGRDLPTANALVLGTSYGTIPIAAGVFAGIAALPVGGLPWISSHDLALVFWIDAVTFILSAVFIMRITGMSRGSPKAKDPPGAKIEPEEKPDHSLSSGFKLPLIRQIMPAVAAISIGLGALFSLGIALIREELNATDVEFGILILLFGAGAMLGLAATRKMGTNHLSITRTGTLAMGTVVAVMALSPYLWGTFLGAVGFGMGATIALTAGMSTLQSSLSEEKRVLAFAIFHLVIRISLGASAVITGLIGDVFDDVPVGWGNHLAGTRIVLLAAGVLVFVAAWFTRASSKQN